MYPDHQNLQLLSKNARDSISNLDESNLTIGLNQYLSDAHNSKFWGTSISSDEANSLGKVISDFLANNAGYERKTALLLAQIFAA